MNTHTHTRHKMIRDTQYNILKDLWKIIEVYSPNDFMLG